MLASIVYLGWWILAHGDVSALWGAGGPGRLVLARGRPRDRALASRGSRSSPTTRASRTTRRAAFWGVGLGYLLPTLFQFGFGSILVLSHPSIDGPTAVLVTVAAGGVGSLLALLALTVDETDEAFANVYSTAVSIQNLLPQVPQRGLVVAMAAAATRRRARARPHGYQQFLLLLGAFFVPLFGVLLADWLLNGMHYEPADIFRAPAFRPGMIVSWLAGFAVYEWLAQTQDLGFWTDFLARLHPPHSQIGASLPGFAVSFALATAVSFAARRSGALALSRQAS